MTRGKTLIALVLALVALIVAGIPLYVRPQTDPLRPADAIVVLGGVPYERFNFGIELAEQGLAPQVLISNSVGASDPRMRQICQAKHTNFLVNCFVPDPWTTRGEAQQIRDEAAQNGWKHIIVVTYAPHISRARFIVSRCFSGELTMVESPTDLSFSGWVGAYLYQTGGFVKAFTERGC